jgi:hypothetical protein
MGFWMRGYCKKCGLMFEDKVFDYQDNDEDNRIRCPICDTSGKAKEFDAEEGCLQSDDLKDYYKKIKQNAELKEDIETAWEVLSHLCNNDNEFSVDCEICWQGVDWLNRNKPTKGE